MAIVTKGTPQYEAEKTKIDERFNALWKQHVPNQGPAKTRFAEFIRCLGRVEYELWNNGNGNFREQARRYSDGKAGDINTYLSMAGYVKSYLDAMGAPPDVISVGNKAMKPSNTDYDRAEAWFLRIKQWAIQHNGTNGGSQPLNPEDDAAFTAEADVAQEGTTDAMKGGHSFFRQ